MNYRKTTRTATVLVATFFLLGAGDAAPQRVPLRKTGFLFLELETTKLDEYAAFFERVTDFKVVERKEGFVTMESDRGELMLMDPGGLPKGHPFYGKPNDGHDGRGVEIGIVVEDLDRAFAAAKASGWRISAEIGKRPWGVRDFRVLAPDGYYLRVTEGS